MRVKRVVAAAVGAWMSLFVAVPALAAAPPAGSAQAKAVNLQVSPLAVVPLSSLSSLPGSSILTSLEGDITVTLDEGLASGKVKNNAFTTSSGQSQPVVIQVAALATELTAVENLLKSLGAGSAVTTIQGVQQELEGTLTGAGLGDLNTYINQLENGSVEGVPATASYPAGPLFDSEAFLPKSEGGSLIENTKVLVPYTASAAGNKASAVSTLDSLGVINGGPDLGNVLSTLNALLAQLQTTLSTLQAAETQGVTTVTGTLAGTLGTVLGTVPAGTTVSGEISTVQSTISSLSNLIGTLTALNGSLADLSQVVATTGVATNVQTVTSGGWVDSLATTKVAAIDIVTVNSPQLTELLGNGVAQGKALVSIIGATSTAEAKADGIHPSVATGSASFTRISALAGTPAETNICFAASDCAGYANPIVLSGALANTPVSSCTSDASGAPTCTVAAGPLSIVIEASHACACTDSTHNGGDATFASASTSALRVLVNFTGSVTSLLTAAGVSGVKAAAPASAAGTTNLATVQLANATATAGDINSVVNGTHLPPTGSLYGAGLLVAMLLLVLAGGFGLSFRMGWLPVRK